MLKIAIHEAMLRYVEYIDVAKILCCYALMALWLRLPLCRLIHRRACAQHDALFSLLTPCYADALDVLLRHLSLFALRYHMPTSLIRCCYMLFR